MGRDPGWSVAIDPRLARRVEIGNLCEREILGESLRREFLDRAAQQRKKCPAGGMRAAGSTIEIRRNPGAAQRMLEDAKILLRRSDENRHLVEAHATRRFLEKPARDLDALAAFARRRKPHELARSIAFGRRLWRKQIAREMSEIVVLTVLQELGIDTAIAKLRDRS